jgi:hypothetical protein
VTGFTTNRRRRKTSQKENQTIIRSKNNMNNPDDRFFMGPKRLKPETVVLLALLCCATVGSAQSIAYDDASGYTTWTNGSNLGYGFGPWTLAQTGTSNGNYTGFYINGGGDAIASPNGNAWGLYANGSGGSNAVVAFRPFTNGLATNTFFTIKWHNKGIGFSTANSGGFCLCNGNADGSVTNYNTGARFEFFYAGGGNDGFQIVDGSGTNYVFNPNSFGSPFLTFGSNPFQVEFTLLTSNTYRLDIWSATGAILFPDYTNTLAGSGSINSVSLYAFQTDGDQLFNAMQIASTSLIPPQIINTYPANGTIYVPFTNKLSFNASSAFSTLPTNGFTVLLNGVAQTNLSVTGPATNRVVVVNDPLPDNMVNTAVFIVTDANGNQATNTITFNTFDSNNLFIEAGDYNYNAGNWIDNSATPQPNQDYQGFLIVTTIYGNFYYAHGLFGSNGIDYFEYNLAGTNNAYRPDDLPEVEVCSDVDHHNFASLGYTPYDLAYNVTGQWEDYTRQMSNITYTVYARMAGFAPYGGSSIMEMERAVAPTVSSTDQPRASLGTFTCPYTGAAQNWTFVQLEDLFSNPVQVRLPGTNTFRTTCIGSSYSYNLAYLVFIPSTDTNFILPYVSSGFPVAGAQVLATNPPISFTIANGQSAVLPGTIELSLNGSNVTAGLILSNNAAGSVVSYQPVGTMVPLDSTNTLQVVFGDGTVMQTNQWQFTTADLPRVLSTSAGPAATNSVNGTVQIVFNAAVYPGYLPTTVFFQFGLDTNYGGVTTATTTGSSPNAIPVNSTVNGFSEGFTYHYSCVVSNAEGVSQSPDQTFVVGAAGSATTSTPPQISGFADVSTPVNTPTPPIPFTVSDAQTPAANLTVSAIAEHPNLVPTNGFIFGGAGSNRTLTITPAPGQQGPTTILVSVSDGIATASESFILSVGVVVMVPGQTNYAGIVDQNELNAVLANYWPYSPWLYMTNVAGLGGTNVTFALTNSIAGAFSVQYSTDLVNWDYLGPATPQYLFTDTNAPGMPQRYYRLSYP